MPRVTVELPDDLARLLGDGASAERRVLEATVVELFRDAKISSGRASELLGIQRQDFLDLLYRKRIPFLSLPGKE